MAEPSWLRYEGEVTDDAMLAVAELDLAVERLRAADAELAALGAVSWSSPAVGDWLSARHAFCEAWTTVCAYLGTEVCDALGVDGVLSPP